MPLRTFDEPLGSSPSTKTYATRETAEAKAREIAGHCRGMVNVSIIPVKTELKVRSKLAAQAGLIVATPVYRYTAVFSCFEDKNDAQHVARAGFHCFA